MDLRRIRGGALDCSVRDVASAYSARELICSDIRRQRGDLFKDQGLGIWTGDKVRMRPGIRGWAFSGPHAATPKYQTLGAIWFGDVYISTTSAYNIYFRSRAFNLRNPSIFKQINATCGGFCRYPRAEGFAGAMPLL